MVAIRNDALLDSRASKATFQYLNRYAECDTPDPYLLENLGSHDFALVIPAYKEDFDFVEGLAKRPDAEQILLLLVLNEPETDRCNSQNARFMQTLRNRANSQAEGAHFAIHVLGKLTILSIDHTGTRALPAKQGVGRARKIGADLACHLFTLNKIRQPWIFSSDADARLSSDHFVAPKDTNASAYYYPFRHFGGDAALREATQTYERCLYYYTTQLSRAGSPYAFHTLGSAMAISISHYCHARGFPKRAGGEDFYLFNKLAKLAPIHYAIGCEVAIRSRASDRVPFGTGPAVIRIMEQHAAGQEPCYYSPRIFDELKLLLQHVSQSWRCSETLQNQLSAAAWQALQDAGFSQFLAKRKQQDKNETQFMKHFHQWFDAFQTLKFIHRLQSSYPDVPVKAIHEDLIYN